MDSDEAPANVEAVAIAIARRRMEVPITRYSAADVIDDNDVGWTVPYVGTVHLPADQLNTAWMISTRMVRAWA